MKSRLLARAIPVLVLMGSLAACVDDPSALSDERIPISEAEAELLGLTLWRSSIEARLASEDELAAASPAAGAPARVPRDVDESVTVSFPCEVGGTLDFELVLTGTYDDEVGTGDLTLQMILTPNQCARRPVDDVFVLNGYPDLTVTVRVVQRSVDDPIELSGGIDGGVLIHSQDSEGSAICFANIDFVGDQDDDGNEIYRITGTMCGAPVDEVASIDAGDTGG